MLVGRTNLNPLKASMIKILKAHDAKPLEKREEALSLGLGANVTRTYRIKLENVRLRLMPKLPGRELPDNYFLQVAFAFIARTEAKLSDFELKHARCGAGTVKFQVGKELNASDFLNAIWDEVDKMTNINCP